MEIKTVSVVSKDPKYHNGEPFTINEADFDAEKHELLEPNKSPEPIAGDSGGNDGDKGADTKGKSKK